LAQSRKKIQFLPLFGGNKSLVAAKSTNSPFPDMDDFGFDARVWRLEQLLVDLSAKNITKNESMYENEGLSDRIMKLQNDLEGVLVDDKALRDFVDKCKQAH
jgi:hypothetical protein